MFLNFISSSMEDKYRCKNLKVVTPAFRFLKNSIWCAISRKRIVETLFFESTVDWIVFRGLIQKFFALLEVNVRDSWFQHDSTKFYTSDETKEYLKNILAIDLPQKIFDYRNSLILASRTFFLWGYLKNEFYTNNTQTDNNTQM